MKINPKISLCSSLPRSMLTIMVKVVEGIKWDGNGSYRDKWSCFSRFPRVKLAFLLVFTFTSSLVVKHSFSTLPDFHVIGERYHFYQDMKERRGKLIPANEISRLSVTHTLNSSTVCSAFTCSSFLQTLFHHSDEPRKDTPFHINHRTPFNYR